MTRTYPGGRKLVVDEGYFTAKINLAERIKNALSLIEKGESVTCACKMNELDYLTVRRFLKMDFDIHPAPIVNIDLSEFYTWEDEFIFDVLGPGHYVLPDFDEAYKKVTEDLTEREKTVVRMRYKEGYSLDDIGKEFNVTRERVRQVLIKAMKRIQHPVRVKYLELGMSAVEIKELEEEKNRLTKERDRLLKQLRGEVGELKEEVGNLLNTHDSLRIMDEDANPIEKLDLSFRAHNLLRRRGINTIGELRRMSLDDLQGVRNMGIKSMREITDKLYHYYGIRLEGHTSDKETSAHPCQMTDDEFDDFIKEFSSCD